MSLSQWGWNSYFEAMWSEADRENTVPARVVAQHRNFWRVAGAFGECLAEPSGKLRLAAKEGADWPAVGDWVSVELHRKPIRRQSSTQSYQDAIASSANPQVKGSKNKSSPPT